MKKHFFTLITVCCIATYSVTLDGISNRFLTKTASVIKKPLSLLCSGAIFYALSKRNAAHAPFLSTSYKDILQATAFGCAATSIYGFIKKEKELDTLKVASAYGSPLICGLLLYGNNKVENYFSQKKWLSVLFDTGTSWNYTTIIGALATIQTAAYFYERTPQQDSMSLLALLVKELQLDHFLDVLLTTSETEIQINFPHQKVALAYFLKEYEITKSDRTLSYITRLQDGSLSVFEGPLTVNVQAARETNFFISWILGMQQAALKNNNKTSYITAAKQNGTAFILMRLPYSQWCEYVTFRTVLTYSIELFDDLVIQYKNKLYTKKRTCHKALLA